MLLVAAAYTPLRGYLGNLDKFPHPGRLVLVILAYLVLGLTWFVLIDRLLKARQASLISSLTFLMLLGSGGTLVMSTSTFIGILALFGLALAIALLMKRAPEEFGRFLIRGVVVFLVVGIVLAWSPPAGDSDVIDVAEASVRLRLDTRPDIFVIVVDGFPGDRAIEEVYRSSLDVADQPDVLRAEAWASYPITLASVASFLDMRYHLGDGEVVDGEAGGELARVMAGENRFTTTLDDNGYHVTYLESGYSRSYCGGAVDLCVDSAFLDEGTHWVLGQSILGRELREETGSAFTHGAVHTMDWLRDHLLTIANDDHRDFVFANVLAPHPPLFLDANCELTYEYWRVGNSVYAGDEIIEQRQSALIQQTECVAAFENQLFQIVPRDAVLIFVSDHGGDSLGQMSKADRVWSRQDALERLNVHFAMRSPMTCGFGEEVFLVEILRELLWCLAGSEASQPALPGRMFTASRIEDTTNYVLDELTVDEMRAVGVVGD